MKPKRKIKAREVVHDIRNGMTDYGLMEKYRLSTKGVQSLLKKLLDIHAITRDDLQRRVEYDDSVTVDDLRDFLRNRIATTVAIHVADNLSQGGILLDISEKGFKTDGINIDVDETKCFVIQADEFHDVEPMVFDAVCVWTKQDSPDDSLLAGFQITDISEGGLRELRKLITAITLETAGVPSEDDFR